MGENTNASKNPAIIDNKIGFNKRKDNIINTPIIKIVIAFLKYSSSILFLRRGNLKTLLYELDGTDVSVMEKVYK